MQTIGIAVIDEKNYILRVKNIVGEDWYSKWTRTEKMAMDVSKIESRKHRIIVSTTRLITVLSMEAVHILPTHNSLCFITSLRESRLAFVHTGQTGA